jgi:hypothetical protein
MNIDEHRWTPASFPALWWDIRVWSSSHQMKDFEIPKRLVIQVRYTIPLSSSTTTRTRKPGLGGWMNPRLRLKRLKFEPYLNSPRCQWLYKYFLLIVHDRRDSLGPNLLHNTKAIQSHFSQHYLQWCHPQLSRLTPSRYLQEFKFTSRMRRTNRSRFFFNLITTRSEVMGLDPRTLLYWPVRLSLYSYV